jgi:LPXTG-site transpeptidase (sortase) family protein
MGLFVAMLGGGLVVQGEIQRARDDERFREAQVALKAGIEAFSTDNAPTDNPRRDPNVGNESPAAPVPDSAPSTTQDAAANVRAIGRLQIPAIDLDVAMVRYVRYADLEIGLAWMPQSAELGANGASIIIGHRTLFGAPLRNADEVKPGDQIFLSLPDGSTRTYEVRAMVIRKPTETFNDLLSHDAASRIVIVTCHPEYSTKFRLVVVADVVATA